MPKPLKTEKDASARPELSAGKILVAEDSAIYRRLIETHLNDWGFEFQCVRDGKEAWKLLSHKDAPRLALLDWVLPEIDGVELCRRLRNRPEDAPYTYTILLTAKSRKDEMLEAMNAGADDFLAKPIEPSELKARLLVGKRIVDLQQKLVSQGYQVRVYVPYGSQWYPYLMRRMAERPANLVFVMSNAVRR